MLRPTDLDEIDIEHAEQQLAALAADGRAVRVPAERGGGWQPAAARSAAA